MMKHPKTFLLEKIIHNDKNGLKSLGHLEAKFIDDISEVMRDFAEQTVIDVTKRLNGGEELRVKNYTINLQTLRKKDGQSLLFQEHEDIIKEEINTTNQ